MSYSSYLCFRFICSNRHLKSDILFFYPRFIRTFFFLPSFHADKTRWDHGDLEGTFSDGQGRCLVIPNTVCSTTRLFSLKYGPGKMNRTVVFTPPKKLKKKGHSKHSKYTVSPLYSIYFTRNYRGILFRDPRHHRFVTTRNTLHYNSVRAFFSSTKAHAGKPAIAFYCMPYSAKPIEPGSNLKVSWLIILISWFPRPV